MPNNINITSSNNLAPFLTFFERKGIKWREVAAHYYFPEDLLKGEYWLSSSQVMGFLSSMMQQTQQNIGYEVGRLITLDQISPQLTREFSECEDFQQGIQRLIEVMPQFNNYVVVWAEKIEGKWYLCHRGSYHPSLPGYDQAEWFRTFAFMSLCRYFLGDDWEPTSIRMSFPSHLAIGLGQTFKSSSLEFGHSVAAIEIPLTNHFSPFTLPDKQEWLEVISALIKTYAVLPRFNIDWLSALIGTSARSMQRQLTQRGMTFRQLRDEARCEVATKLLTENVSPFETAWRCGYSDLSNFNRAFKGWLGMTPSQYQNQSHK